MHDEFPAVFSQTFHVRYDECGPGGWLRASAHLRAFQEIAFGHSAALGFPLAWYEQQRLFWVLRRIRLVMHAPARYGDALTYTTRVQGARRVMARRFNTAHRSGDGARIASCFADWIFTKDGTQTTRITDDLVAAFPTMMQPVMLQPVDEAARPAGRQAESLRLRITDLDAMQHANHPIYFDLLDDAVARAGGLEVLNAHPRSYDVQYESAAASGEALQDLAWPDGDAWHYRMERADGLLVMHGRVSLSDREPSGEHA